MTMENQQEEEKPVATTQIANMLILVAILGTYNSTE